MEKSKKDNKEVKMSKLRLRYETVQNMYKSFRADKNLKPEVIEIDFKNKRKKHG